MYTSGGGGGGGMWGEGGGVHIFVRDVFCRLLHRVTRIKLILHCSFI